MIVLVHNFVVMEELDEKNRKDGSDLDEMKAHMFLEKQGTAFSFVRVLRVLCDNFHTSARIGAKLVVTNKAVLLVYCITNQTPGCTCSK